MFDNSNSQPSTRSAGKANTRQQVLYTHPIQKLKVNTNSITATVANFYQVDEETARRWSHSMRIIEDSSGNKYKLTGQLWRYSYLREEFYIDRKYIKITKDGKLLERGDEVYLENAQFMIISPIDSITFKYEKGSPFSLEFYNNKQKIQEFKTQILNCTTTTIIEVERYGTKYKYVIEKIDSHEINGNIFKVIFYGRVYRNGELFIDEHTKYFTCTTEDPTCIFSQLQQSTDTKPIEENVDPKSQHETQKNSDKKRVQFANNVGPPQKTKTTQPKRKLNAANNTDNQPAARMNNAKPQPAKTTNSSNHETQKNSNKKRVRFANNTNSQNDYKIYGATVVGAAIGAITACFAGAAALPPFTAIAVFIAAIAVSALVGYCIAKFCEKVSEEKRENPGTGTLTVIKNILTPECFKSSQLQVKP